MSRSVLLNERQQEAVLATEGPVLVIAGAGSGKTRVLTERIAHLIGDLGVAPWEILAFTFTNKAAREMKERLERITPGATQSMWVGTFHSTGVRILRRHGEAAGVKRDFSIHDADDSVNLVKTILQRHPNDARFIKSPRVLRDLISRMKNDLIPPSLAAQRATGSGEERVAVLYAEYEKELRRQNALDFDDLIMKVVELFAASDEARETYARRFHYILVDEFQDTNAIQMAMIDGLSSVRRNLFVVGDDDQSIYSWRGAEVANILRFEEDFPGAAVIRLEQNYRSTPHILGAATGLIANNSGRLGKTLWTTRNDGDPVKVIGVWDGPEEARRVGEEIEAHVRKDGSLDDTAILVRAQFQTREFEERFISIGLAYQIVGGFRFYERAEIRDALAYLRLVAQPSDDLAFDRIVNVPKRGLGDKAVANIHQFARATGQPLLLAAAQMVDSDELTPQARRSLARFIGDIARWRNRLNRPSLALTGEVSAQADGGSSSTPNLPHAELARIILDESGYTAVLQAERSAESAGRLENLTELTRAMEEYETLGAFLEHVSLVMDNDAKRGEPKVTIMTIHAAKGLEFPLVFLVGWEEGVFPSQRALDEGGLASLEEERRLAYVAITRARTKATILHAANRRIYGQWTSSIPSRFVAELPEAHVETETTMSGGESLWRAQWSENADPFAHVARAERRGPGFQRAVATDTTPRTGLYVKRGPQESRASAISIGNKGRDDLAVGMRVFHGKFGYGEIAGIEGNKLEIEFEKAGRKRVLDSFVSIGD